MTLEERIERLEKLAKLDDIELLPVPTSCSGGLETTIQIVSAVNKLILIMETHLKERSANGKAFPYHE